MATHCFSFSGGEMRQVSTFQSRISAYRSGEEYHESWLNEVLAMNPSNLNKNTIGLDAYQIKKMAQEILEHWK